MKNTLIAFLLIVPLALVSCTRTEKNVTLGAATGAIVGGVVTGRASGVVAGAVIGGVLGNNVRSAALGAAIGGVLGAVASQPGQCYYKDEYGRKFIDDCPPDYAVRVRAPRTKVVVRM